MRATFGLVVLAGLVLGACSGSSVGTGGDVSDAFDWSGPDLADALLPDIGVDTKPSDDEPDLIQWQDPAHEVAEVEDAEEAEEVEAPKGLFGTPCDGPEDCASGFCIEGYDGWLCTEFCVDECQSGYSCKGIQLTGSDPVFLCLPLLDRLCEPCSSDVQCSGGRCVELEGGRYCLSECAAGCPDSYECTEYELAGGPASLCRPDNGSCVCTEASLGLEKSCKVTTGSATCYGVRFCEAGGWGDCGLPVEICNGADDDCDGVLDEGFRSVEGVYDTDQACGSCEKNCTIDTYANGAAHCRDVEGVPTCVLECELYYVNVDANPVNGCECVLIQAVDVPGDEWPDANCDGIDGEVANAVFVAKNGDDAAPGFISEPLRSVQAGLELAAGLGLRDVYVATGVYEETLRLASGVHVYGGYSADFRVRDPLVYETVIFGDEPSPADPAAVIADGVTDATTFDGFTVYGGYADDPGESSVAVLVRDCDERLVVRGCRVVAGHGGPGLRGVDGVDGTSGAAGVAGLAAYDIGVNPCTAAHHNAGGAGGVSSCGELDVAGGAGGNSICPDYDETGAGQPKEAPLDQAPEVEEHGSAGAGLAPALGGEPGYDGLLWSGYSSCNVCNAPKTPDGSDWLPQDGSPGQDGADGTQGGGGQGCPSALGAFEGSTWIAGAGSDGGAGGPGNGGGGGGAGGGVETWGCTGAPQVLYTDVGGSGGGGGSGGCGAVGGTGGTGGGGSFGVLVVFGAAPASLPVLAGNVIETGVGGDGGAGGYGGVGGLGGDGRNGGDDGDDTYTAWCAGGGGRGGQGGDGGHGGGGGGGCGGASYGIYVHGATGSAAYTLDNDVALEGAGGQGGSGGSALGPDGTAGVAGPHASTNF